MEIIIFRTPYRGQSNN